MVDISTVSIVIASTGVLIAATYYILQIRHQNRMRQTDLLMRLHLAFSSKERVEAALKYMNTEYKDYDDFVERYGLPFAEGQVQTVFLMMGMFFEGIGILLKRKLVQLDLVTDLFAVEMLWLKWKPLAEGLRKVTNNPHFGEWFEYVYNEMKKREQKLKQLGAKSG